MSTTQKTHLGIVLAGAVTAGAFTAGAIDYIVNTLNQWELAYKNDKRNVVPKPNVVIDVLTGASAGSIAAAVTTLGLSINSLPFVEDVNSETASKNLLYDTWVNLGLEENQNMIDLLLSLNDIKNKDNEVVINSLLNTSFIDNMMNKLVNRVNDYLEQNYSNPEKTTLLPNFVNPNLEILMTLSNLRGIPIDLYFSSEKDKVGHSMTYHKAYALFEYGKKYYDPHSEAAILPFNIRNEQHVKVFLRSARASGAFPIGLKSIPFNKVNNAYIKANIKRLFGNENNIEPRLSKEGYDFIAVDGGMTNNEPLAEALKSLKTKGENYRMILVDPFPSYIKPDKKYDTTKSSIYSILPQLITTLRDQAIFKENDIIDLFKENTKKHMIWPTRSDKNGNSLPNAIACGALEGFSGFLDKKFRVHDYRLGQKNAQSFIRKYFYTEITNTSHFSPEFINRFAIKDDEKGIYKVPIIPDYTIQNKNQLNGTAVFSPSLKNELEPYPVVDVKPMIEQIELPLQKRIRKIVDVSFNQFKKEKFDTRQTYIHSLISDRNSKSIPEEIFNSILKKTGDFFMNLIGKNLLSKSITRKAIDILIKELDDFKLIK